MLQTVPGRVGEASELHQLEVVLNTVSAFSIRHTTVGSGQRSCEEAKDEKRWLHPKERILVRDSL